MDQEGNLLATARRETPATDAEEIEQAIAEAVIELRESHEVDAVGVAAAGFIDKTRSIVTFAPNLAWRNEPLRADLEKKVDLPVLVENDANAAAWGEFRFGAGREVDDMLLVTVGTGIGGGIVLDGNLLRGAYGMAAEIGHQRVVPDGIRCGCGNRGCWEKYGSGSALVREARELASSGALSAGRLLDLAEGKAKRITGQMVTQAAAEGDAAALELLQDLGRWVGEGIASLAAVLDPAVVVIGGGVSEAGDLLMDPVRQAFRRSLTARGHRPEADLRLAGLGNEAGMIGVGDLAAGTRGSARE